VFQKLRLTRLSRLPNGAYQAAQANPITRQYARTELSQAEQTLRKAEGATSEAEREHFAKLAQQQVQQAVTMAERNKVKADKERATTGKESSTSPVAAADTMTCEDPKIQRVEDLVGELNGKKTGQGWILLFGDDQFEAGKANLLPVGKHSLSKVAVFLKNSPQRKAKIEAYTDNVGDRDYNLGLSQRRADEVRFALVNCGIASNRVLAKGFGSATPVANNSQEAGRKKNRRVEIIILNEGEGL
jgi:OmpA-OmpF porin, OOP family